MLNDVLAVCVAGTVVVVIATILGAVELLRKAVAAIAGRRSGLQAWCSRHSSDPGGPQNDTTATRRSPAGELWLHSGPTPAHFSRRGEGLDERVLLAPSHVQIVIPDRAPVLDVLPLSGALHEADSRHQRVVLGTIGRSRRPAAHCGSTVLALGPRSESSERRISRRPMNQVSCDQCEDERSRREPATSSGSRDRTITASPGRGSESDRTAPCGPLVDYPRCRVRRHLP